MRKRRKSNARRKIEDTIFALVLLIAMFVAAASLVTVFARSYSSKEYNLKKVEISEPVTKESLADEKYREEKRKELEVYMDPEWQDEHDHTRITPETE